MRLSNIWRLAATLFLAAALPAAAELTQQIEVSALAMAHDQFRIDPSSKHLVIPVVIDAAPFVTASVTSPSKTLSVSLIAPNGTTYHIGDPDTAAFESSVTPDPLSPDSHGANYLANLYTPAAGTWKLDITETASITAPVDGLYMLLFDNDTRAVMLGGGRTFLAGQSVPLYLAVFDGTANVHALTINASQLHADGAVGVPLPVAFHDDGMAGDTTAGDGLYTALVSTPAAGRFQVNAVISGSASGGAFQRTVATNFAVVPVRATLYGTFADSAVDTNGDGFTDAVQIRPAGTVNVGGDFVTTVRLRASNGNVMQRSTTATLTAGAAIPPVNFPAPGMESELAVDGPYSVDLVTVEFVALDLELAARQVSLGSTSAYHLADFHHEPLRLTGTNTATGLDTNGNLKFDYLHVTLGIYAQTTGWYNYSASLHDSGGKELGFVTSWVYLNSGNNDLAFDFSGWAIGQNGIDGPYSVDGLLMYGNYYGMGSLSVDRVFATQAFKASQFEGFKGDTTPPVLSVSVSPQILYPPNHKMTEITPAITVSDDIDPNPTVQLLSIVSNEGQNVRGDGNTDTDIYIDPSGKLFVRSERTGMDTDRIYTFTWSARDASGNTTTATATVTVPHDQSKK